MPTYIASRIIAHIPKEGIRGSLLEYNLTYREMEISEYMAKGYHNNRIAEKLQISMGTVKNYISSIYSKLEVKNRQQAILLINSLKNK
jgi:DNA-binding NarL/FixJ family response regulator